MWFRNVAMLYSSGVVESCREDWRHSLQSEEGKHAKWGGGGLWFPMCLSDVFYVPLWCTLCLSLMSSVSLSYVQFVSLFCHLFLFLISYVSLQWILCLSLMASLYLSNVFWTLVFVGCVSVWFSLCLSLILFCVSLWCPMCLSLMFSMSLSDVHFVSVSCLLCVYLMSPVSLYDVICVPL